MQVRNYEECSVEDARYPRLLKEIFSPPERIYVRGELLPDEPTIAIVGTRKPSTYGIEAAQFFARELASAGITIVSGLAFGIDKAAHEACLDAGARTIAVLASGIDIITPRSHEKLGRRITEHGAIISEFIPGTDARPEQFPQRNRLISGLSLGVIVVEAPEESGALITARFAAEQSREVFIVPGPIFSPNYKGSHALIQEGAKLVTNAADVLEELNLAERTPQIAQLSIDNILPETARNILEALRERDGQSSDELAKKLGISASELAANLTTLELKHYIRRHAEHVYLHSAEK